MKKQLSDQDKHISKQSFLNIIIPVFTGIIMFFSSCENSDIEKIKAITSELHAPTMAVSNTEIIYSENGLIKRKLISPQINQYLNIEKPYTEFPEGLHVEFYDSTENVSSYIKAKYCINDETEQLWTAQNNVVVVSAKGDTLNTEFLIWNQKTKKIYSDQYVRISNKSGVVHGKGFEADEDLTNWKIKQTSGTISIDKEDEKEQENK
jgi:lipopolysaccharide export system protein LptC